MSSNKIEISIKDIPEITEALQEAEKEIERLEQALQEEKKTTDHAYKLWKSIDNSHIEKIYKLEKKIERLNNIINELEEYLQNEIYNGRSEDNVWLMGCYDEARESLDKLHELIGSDKE